MCMIEDDRILSCGNIRRYVKNKNLISNYTQLEYIQNTGTQLIETENFDDRPANMNYLDRLLKGVKNNYTKLEYIAANGTQYIELDYIPNSETCIECEFSIDKIFDSVESNKQPLYGSSEMYNKNAFEFWPQAYGFSCYDSNNYKTHTGVKLSETNHVVQNKNTLTVNDTVSTFTYRSFTCPKNLTIFATNRSSQGVSIFNYEGSVLKLFYLKISENGSVLHDLVPAYLDDTNESGLYDLIDGKFYQNKNTGSSFITGDVVNDVSSISNRPVSAYVFKKILSNIKPYTKLQYITFNGKEYIDTEYIANGATHVNMYCKIAPQLEKTTFPIFGARKDTNSKSFTLWRLQTTSIRYDYNTYNKTSNSYALGPGSSYEIDANRGTLLVQGSMQYNYAKSTFSCEDSMKIGAVRSSDGHGGVEIDARRFKGNISWFKIWDNDILVRDYIPVRTADGSVGLWDLVEDKFYGNAGTGSFVAGPEI